MTNPDYKIKELFDPETMRVYFRVISMGPEYPRFIGPQFDTLDDAKYCVRMCRKYKNRIYHYVED
jgi:hypothetical protein